MMRLYLLYEFDYDYQCNEGVFSTRKKAVEAKVKLMLGNVEGFYEIEEFELDKPGEIKC